MSQLLELKLDELSESPSNPRKAFDEIDLTELAESIKAVGLLQPIVVLPKRKSKTYEIVCGHRRFRASKMAKLKQIPAMVRDDLTSDQALELQITENLQRKDVHPLDEAIAFKRLIDERKYKVPDVAAKMGKSEKFVVQRLKLNDLIDDIQKPFYANKLNITQAFQLARLVPADQQKLYSDDLTHWEDDGFGPDNVNIEWEIRRLKLELSSAVFDTQDPALVKAAGACIHCPKNTSCNTLLFPEDEGQAKCTDRQCFDLKTSRHLDNLIKQLEKEGEDFYLIGRSWDKIADEDKYKKAGFLPDWFQFYWYDKKISQITWPIRKRSSEMHDVFEASRT